MGVERTPNRVAGALTVLLFLGVMLPAAPPAGAQEPTACEPAEPFLPEEFENWCPPLPCNGPIEEWIAQGCISPSGCDLGPVPPDVPPQHVPCVPCLPPDPLVPELPPEELPCFNNIVLPGTPNVHANAYIDKYFDAQDMICTGTLNSAAEVEGGFTLGGGVIPASITFGGSADVLTHWTISCAYGMWIEASAYGGFLRRLRLAITVDDDGGVETVGAACGYTGLPANEDCFLKHRIAGDSLYAQGYSAVGGPLPIGVTTCPPPLVGGAWAFNEPWQGLPLKEVKDHDSWTCTDFGINYN